MRKNAGYTGAEYAGETACQERFSAEIGMRTEAGSGLGRGLPGRNPSDQALFFIAS